MIRNKITVNFLLIIIFYCLIFSGSVNGQIKKKLSIDGTASKLSIKIKDADLRDFLLALAEIGGINLIIGPEVKGRVTLSLNDVTWREALDAALFFNDMGYIEISSNGIVGSYDKMKSMVGKLEDVLLESSTGNDKQEEFLTLAYPMSFEDAKEYYNEIFPLLSSKGKYQYNNKTHCAQVIDLKENALKIMDLITSRVEKKKEPVD